MILLIDNYDSFVYNLARYVAELGHTYVVKRNDAVTIAEIESLNPSHIIISPGPCAPDQAGVSMEVIRFFATKIPILGVCLGHQAMAQVFGAVIGRAKHPMHGQSSFIHHTEEKIFSGLENPLQVGRYHSLIVNDENFPAELIVTARCSAGEIMAFSHRQYPLFGVQFHPESIMTAQGLHLVKNFINQLNYPMPSNM